MNFEAAICNISLNSTLQNTIRRFGKSCNLPRTALEPLRDIPVFRLNEITLSSRLALLEIRHLNSLLDAI